MDKPAARHQFPDGDALAAALAGVIAEKLGEAIAARGEAIIAVSGGTTPARFFQALSRQDIAWDKVIVTLVDERFVPRSSPRSNAALVREKLLQGPAAAARFVDLYRDTASADEAALMLDAAMRELPRPLDVVVLGMGGDGHTASFFPDATNLDTLLDTGSKALVLPVVAPSAPEPRLTLTLAAIGDAGFIALHIEGNAKLDVLERALGGDAILPIGAVLEDAATPVQIFWAP